MNGSWLFFKVQYPEMTTPHQRPSTSVFISAGLVDKRPADPQVQRTHPIWGTPILDFLNERQATYLSLLRFIWTLKTIQAKPGRTIIFLWHTSCSYSLALLASIVQQRGRCSYSPLPLSCVSMAWRRQASFGQCMIIHHPAETLKR